MKFDVYVRVENIFGDCEDYELIGTIKDCGIYNAYARLENTQNGITYDYQEIADAISDNQDLSDNLCIDNFKFNDSEIQDVRDYLESAYEDVPLIQEIVKEWTNEQMHELILEYSYLNTGWCDCYEGDLNDLYAEFNNPYVDDFMTRIAEQIATDAIDCPQYFEWIG